MAGIATHDLVGALLDRMTQRLKQSIQLRNVLVTQITPAASVDGRTQVAVAIGGQDVLAPYFDSYAPGVVGEAVLVLTVFGSPVILGRPHGLPNF